ncbi:MAG: hypothetical protein JF601_05475, partial [Acidobacteria bacterium]|nr:hypothetical protein [Acidobacteriota bacterium]
MKPLTIPSYFRQRRTLGVAGCTLIATALLIAACRAAAIDAPPGLVKIHIAPRTQTIAIGATQQFAVTGDLRDGSPTTHVSVNYSATGGTVTSGGLYTAGSTAGTYSVVAAQLDGTLADTATVTIPSAAQTVTAVVISPATASVPAGLKQQFTAQGVLSSGDTAAISITAAVVTGIAISPKAAAVATNSTQQFSTSLKLSTGATQAPPANSVTYTATGGTVSSAGLYTASNAPGTYKVIAAYTPTGGNTVADTATVTVATTSSTVADPTQLPAANRQSPDYAHYVGGTLAAGQSYADAATGVRVWKLTDANTPLRNSGMSHDYSSGSVQVTRGWGATGTTHTVLMLQG